MATVTGVRLPIHRRTRQNLRKIATRGVEFDLLNLLTLDMVRYDEDFLGSTTFATGQLWTTGGGGTAAAFLANEVGGAAALVTGAVDNQASTLYLGNANVKASQHPVLAVRLKLAAVTAVNVQVGFVDTNTAAVLGATGVGPFVSPTANPPTLTAGASDAVAIVMDTSTALVTSPTSSAAFWSLCYSKAGTAGIVIPSGSVPAADIAPVATTYQWIVLRLVQENEATADIDAYAYVNSHLLASKVAAVTTAATALYPFILVGSAGGVSQTMTVDAISLWFDRDSTA